MRLQRLARRRSRTCPGSRPPRGVWKIRMTSPSGPVSTCDRAGRRRSAHALILKERGARPSQPGPVMRRNAVRRWAPRSLRPWRKPWGSASGLVLLVAASSSSDRADDQQQQQEQQQREDDPELLGALGLLADVAAAVTGRSRRLCADLGSKQCGHCSIRGREHGGAARDVAAVVAQHVGERRGDVHRALRSAGRARCRGWSQSIQSVIASDWTSTSATPPGALARDDLGALHLGPSPRPGPRGPAATSAGAGLPLAEPRLQRHEELAGVGAADMGGADRCRRTGSPSSTVVRVTAGRPPPARVRAAAFVEGLASDPGPLSCARSGAYPGPDGTCRATTRR